MVELQKMFEIVMRGKLPNRSLDLRQPPSHSRDEGEWCSMREVSHCSAVEEEWDQGKDKTQIQSDDEILPWSAYGENYCC